MLLEEANNWGKLLISTLRDLINQIPPGRVSTFSEIAKALGDPIARKFVFSYRKVSPYWYRVVNSEGIVKDWYQKLLLQKEGVKFEGNRIANFDQILFTDFQSNYPLRELKRIQENLAKRIRIEGFPEFEKVLAVDLSYKNDLAYVVVGEFDKNKRMLDYKVFKYKVEFPYIPSYLAFREGPPIIEALKSCDLENALLIVNGHGIAHPRKLGLASYVGVYLNVPTIGNTKKLLVGKVVDNKIILNGQVVGYKIGNFYVSPGHLVSLEFVKQFSEEWKGKKYLLPIEIVDKISKRVKL